MKRIFLYIALLSLCLLQSQAQELNAKLAINTEQVQSADKELFSSLETNLSSLLNEQKWTELAFSQNERIDCNIYITISQAQGNNFAGEIQITSRRPVYNSTYITNLMNYRDTRFEFSYMQGQTLDFNNLNIDNNLVAVISFYAYIIIGLDFDSFSPNGGKPFFAQAMDIANKAQSLNTKGWEPFSGRNDNRYDLAVALTDESSGRFHDLWYKYHRTGLDEMSANASRGRIRIIESLDNLQQLFEARPNSALLSMIGEAKINEIVQVCTQATHEEKQNVKKMLSRIFPTKTSIINTLK